LFTFTVLHQPNNQDGGNLRLFFLSDGGREEQKLRHERQRVLSEG
jgi:hypothetical protein